MARITTIKPRTITETSSDNSLPVASPLQSAHSLHGEPMKKRRITTLCPSLVVVPTPLPPQRLATELFQDKTTWLMSLKHMTLSVTRSVVHQ